MGVSAKQIEAFRALMECSTVTAAAERLCISQPAVSRMLERFQDEVGFRVFEKTGNKLKPTAEACIFYDEVKLLYQGLSHLDKIAKDLGRHRRGQIHIGVMPVLSGSWIATHVADFVASRPGVFISVTGVPSRDVKEAISAQRLDIGFSAFAVEDPFIECDLLVSLKAVCIFRTGHELGKKRQLHLRDLTDTPFISLGAVEGSRTHIDHLFDEMGIRRSIIMEVTLASTVCQMVARGAGVSIVAQQAAEEHRHLGLDMRDIAPVPSFPIYMLRSKLRPRSDLVNAFVAKLRTAS